MAFVNDFMALVALHRKAELEALAGRTGMRRNGARLTQREDELLRLWGYSFVLDAFRFHMF